MNKFLERIIEGVIVTDGSMQSVLSSMGFDETPIEIYNLKNPIIIEKIHFEFINAGAEIIQSNTLFGNTISLSQYKLDDRFYEINRKGVWLARTAAINKAFVAGVVGPVGKFLYPVGQLKPDIVSEAFTSQIHALLDGKCDIIMLKSFIDIDELELAYSAVRKISKDIAIIAQKSFPEDGSVLKTEYPKVIANKLYKEGVVAIGTNGTVGPQRMKEIVKSLYGVTNAILSAQPDIGIPTLIDNVASYNATSEYVAQSCKTLVENGVTIIGADGGCLPEHTKAISMAVKGLKVGKPEIIVKPSILKNNSTLDLELAKSKFQKNIGKKLLVSVELDVPRGLDLNSIFKGAEYLSKNEIDAVNISDGARARLRMSPITISHLVQNKTGMECISHFACRDRNMVGLQSELLSAYTLGVNNILSVTGDPAQIGDYPYATSVYDLDSVGLIRALKRMNLGLDLMNNPIGKKTNFMISCACNPVSDNLEREIYRLENKESEGAEIAFTQPLFEVEDFNNFIENTSHLKIPIMVGIIPLRSPNHAQFLHNEVPGMMIPEKLRKRMQSSSNPAKEGIEIAVEFLTELLSIKNKRIAGIYLMPPFEKYDMAIEIMNRVK